MSKVIFITGSTDGIGKLAAIQLAKAGHQVYLHGRNPKKLAHVIEAVQAVSTYEVAGFTADLSNLKAAHRLAEELTAKFPKLDVLINNAGVFNSPNALNQDGLDMRIVVNYLAPYVLTKELLPLLQKGNNPRLINLSSAAQAPVSLDALKGAIQLPAQSTYAQSKLALTMWSFHFAKAHPEIMTIALNPGSLLNTKMVQEAFGRYWSSADKGAQIIYDLAVSPEYDNSTGKYFDNDQGHFGQAHGDAYNERVINQLLVATNELLG